MSNLPSTPQFNAQVEELARIMGKSVDYVLWLLQQVPKEPRQN